MTLLALAPRASRRALLSCALLSCALLLPGCTLYNRVFHRHRNPQACRERPFIGNTDSRPPLQVPEGMSAPDTRNAIKIPPLPAAPVDRSGTEPCLAQPPPFYAKPPAAKPVAPTPPAASGPSSPGAAAAPGAVVPPEPPPPGAPPAQ